MLASEPAPTDSDNFGGKLDASASKGAKPKTKEAQKTQAPLSMSLKNFFKPQTTPQKPPEDIDMHESQLPAGTGAEPLADELGAEAEKADDVEMVAGSQECLADLSNSKENGGHLSPQKMNAADFTGAA